MSRGWGVGLEWGWKIEDSEVHNFSVPSVIYNEGLANNRLGFSV